MIKETTYTKEWITQKAAEISKRADHKLLEKVVHAFGLLEALASTELPFTFKGGTALLLLAEEKPKRFSIDIDIITETKAEDLPKFLDQVLGKAGYLRWEDDNDRKTAGNAPVGHYKFYYTSVIEEGKEEPILLDVLFDKAPYATIIKKDIKHTWLDTDEPQISVNVPDSSSLIGDKLTAFAPNTTGILYTKNRPAEIMKQLFDIGFLFDNVESMDEVRTSYIRTSEEEIGYRQLNVSWAECLADTFNTCLILTNRDEKDEYYQRLLDGNKRLVHFILENYSIEKAILAAAKAAYLTQLVLKPANDKQAYIDPEQIKDLMIDHTQFPKIHRLRKSNPEAFFYWYHALALKG